MANEKRLIDVLAEIRKIQEVLAEHQDQADSVAYRVFESVKTVLEQAPTEDAVEVVHGRWEYQPPTITLNASWKCSACNKVFWEHILETRRFLYCPNCGAKMDGGNDDGC